MNLYVHVPFCIKKCNYCAFHSTCPDVIDWDGYADEILRQLRQFNIKDYEVNTIFFGGGTPSLMPVKYAEKIIRELHLYKKYEWTLEANPRTITSNELKDWKDLGLNRLSVGVQSFDDKELQFLGRIHTAKDAMNLIDSANQIGIRVSGDFIYGLPNHSVDNVIKLCKQINSIGLKHASLYELTIESGTAFAAQPPLAEDLAHDMYSAIQDNLDLYRYEVSNYSINGDVCLHNSYIWAGIEYIGVGESAAGRIKIDDKWFETKVINGEVIKNHLTDRERSTEMVMTGLRTTLGVLPKSLPTNVIDWSFVNKHPEYFKKIGNFLTMTDEGLLLLDGLIVDILK